MWKKHVRLFDKNFNNVCAVCVHRQDRNRGPPTPGWQCPHRSRGQPAPLQIRVEPVPVHDSAGRAPGVRGPGSRW